MDEGSNFRTSSLKPVPVRLFPYTHPSECEVVSHDFDLHFIDGWKKF